MDNTGIHKDVGIIYDFLAKNVAKLETRLLEACRTPDEPTAKGVLAELLDISYVKRVSENVITRLPAEPVVPKYMLSTLTIHEAFSVLTKTADEDMRFATGLAVAPLTYAITRLLQFQLRHKSVVAAEGDQEAVARLLIELHNHDHKLYMTWHSHPGSGPGSTTPSPIDMDFHRRMEACDYPLIGAIVNRHGYLHFFSHQRRFQIAVYGKGLEVIDEQSCIFRLSNVGAI